MNINRRSLMLPALAVGLLGVIPAFADADEDAVAKNLEAFRAAQAVGNTEVLASLCAAELSYSHSSGAVDDKGSLMAGVTNANYKWTSLEYRKSHDPYRRSNRHRALQLCRRAGIYGRRQESSSKPAHPDELAKAGRGLETAVPLGDQALSASPFLSKVPKMWMSGSADGICGVYARQTAMAGHDDLDAGTAALTFIEIGLEARPLYPDSRHYQSTHMSVWCQTLTFLSRRHYVPNSVILM